MLSVHGATRLESQLAALVAHGNWTALAERLASLRSTDTRTAGRLLSERLLLTLQGDTFWAAFTCIVPRNPRAYLGTFLKAATTLRGQHSLSLASPIFTEYASTLVASSRTIDIDKIISRLLPTCADPNEASDFLAIFSLSETEAMNYMYRAHTEACYYLLFDALRRHDDDQQLIIRYATALVKHGGSLSYNFASLLSVYFGLSLPGTTFSLRIAPYRLSQSTDAFSDFAKLLHSI